LKQWEIYTFDFATEGTHPAVIVSHPDRVARAETLNVLLCSSQRVSRPPKKCEVLLNHADGLDWETMVRCDLMYEVNVSRLRQRRGEVSGFRRRAIVSKLMACFAFDQV
jgi:hypothetical protein